MKIESLFPFSIMQLVNFNARNQMWADLHAAQERIVEAVPQTGLAVGIDIGDAGNIHPNNKQEVGLWLALVALKQVYGMDLMAQPVVSRCAQREGWRVTPEPACACR